MKQFDEFYSMEDAAIDTKDCKAPNSNFFGGLGPMNTVADFVTELNDSLFRDILGDEVMDRPLGSFEKDDLFRVMAKIFLNAGFERLAQKS